MLTSAYVCWSVFSETLYWTTRTFEANKKIQKNKSTISTFTFGIFICWDFNDVCQYAFLISSLVYYIFIKDFNFIFGFLNFIIFLISILIVYLFALGIDFLQAF